MHSEKFTTFPGPLTSTLASTLNYTVGDSCLLQPDDPACSAGFAKLCSEDLKVVNIRPSSAPSRTQRFVGARSARPYG